MSAVTFTPEERASMLRATADLDRARALRRLVRGARPGPRCGLCDGDGHLDGNPCSLCNPEALFSPQGSAP